ncbi:hypothetical protein [Comamonas thiooxydans]|nr:hypothetical protein [Comamonas thiooxydans]CUA99339.1 hypothetical protein Ga0061062_108100 [Comamonas thiooxydans]
MLTFILSSGGVSISHQADSVWDALDYAFQHLGHLNKGISCRCLR